MAKKHLKRSPPADRSRMISIGGRKFQMIGTPSSPFGDFYHLSMTTGWPLFIAAVAIVVVAINAVFAALMLFDLGGIANLPAGEPWWAFYFSMETLATVGYGDMHPASEYIHILASIEMIVGLLLGALITGMIFARFSRPSARFLFSEKAVIGMHDGQRCLMLRVANARHNTVSDARAKLWSLQTQVTAEGTSYRRFAEVNLVRNENPTFVLSWTLFHAIDENSPLFGLGEGDLEPKDMAFILAISGNDETVSQPVLARFTYNWAAVAWDHRFADILSNNEDGHLVVDYRRFHDIHPIS